MRRSCLPGAGGRVRVLKFACFRYLTASKGFIKFFQADDLAENFFLFLMTSNALYLQELKYFKFGLDRIIIT
jgi:hypothetical protein